MKRTLLNTTLYLVAFVAIQVLITFVIGAIAPIFGQKSDSGLMLVISSATAGLLTLILFFCAKFTPKGTEYVRSRPWATLAWCSLAALGATIPSLALQELMPALPDTMSDTLMKIVHVPGGYFVLAIMAPLSEEAVFRGAILRELQKAISNKWMAICISAVIFALIHVNPAQMPHAFLMGLLLGWLYAKTNSILPGVVFHTANNTIAYLMAVRFPDPDMKLSDIFAGNTTSMILAILFSLCIFIPATWNIYKDKGRCH